MMKFNLDHLPPPKQRELERVGECTLRLYKMVETACQKHLAKLTRNAGMR